MTVVKVTADKEPIVTTSTVPVKDINVAIPVGLLPHKLGHHTDTAPLLAAVVGQYPKFDGTNWIPETPDWLTIAAWNAKPAALVTLEDLNNWDAAYGWGNHADADYLTATNADSKYVQLNGSYDNPTWINTFSFLKLTDVPDIINVETDPTVPAIVKTITLTDINDWDAAYGWGNHGNAGYITSLTSDITTAGSGAAAATIGNNKVTYAKFQQVAASRLVGNPSGALANASEISLAASLQFNAGALGLNLGNANTWTGQQTFNAPGQPPIFANMTLGSVLFTGTGGLLSQNNSNFFWHNTDLALLIGTSSSINGNYKIQVVGNSSSSGQIWIRSGAGGGAPRGIVVEGGNNARSSIQHTDSASNILGVITFENANFYFGKTKVTTTPAKFTIEGESGVTTTLLVRDNSLAALFTVNNDGGWALKGGTVGTSQTGYSVTNVTAARTFDASTATLADALNVLGTLINDLKTKAIIKA